MHSHSRAHRLTRVRAHTHIHTQATRTFPGVQLRKRVACVDVEREGRGPAGTSMAVESVRWPDMRRKHQETEALPSVKEEDEEKE